MSKRVSLKRVVEECGITLDLSLEQQERMIGNGVTIEVCKRGGNCYIKDPGGEYVPIKLSTYQELIGNNNKPRMPSRRRKSNRH